MPGVSGASSDILRHVVFQRKIGRLANTVLQTRIATDLSRRVVSGHRGTLPRKSDKAKRKSPGRPEGKTGLREAIMASAETAFSDHGYAGTSLRVVADKAGVTTALINYYFGSKMQLHEEVYLQQASVIATARLQALAEIENRPVKPDAGAIVRAFVQPVLEMRKTAAGRSFLRFQWSVDIEPKELSYRLRKKAYDESTRAYAQALHQARPDLSLETCYARLIIIIGATIYASSTRHRMDELVPGIDAETGADLILNEILTFATAMIET